MTEFQEGTLDTLMERLCSSISSFDPEWVKHCVPATEEQIQQLQDILAEYHYMIPAAYLYFLRRMGQDNGGLLEHDCETDIDTILKLLTGNYYCEQLEKGFLLFADHWADCCRYMKLSPMDDNPIVTDMREDYNIAENFEKYLFQRAFRMYQGVFAHSRSDNGDVCKQKKDTEECRTCPYSKDTEEER